MVSTQAVKWKECKPTSDLPTLILFGHVRCPFNVCYDSTRNPANTLICNMYVISKQGCKKTKSNGCRKNILVIISYWKQSKQINFAEEAGDIFFELGKLSSTGLGWFEFWCWFGLWFCLQLISRNKNAIQSRVPSINPPPPIIACTSSTRSARKPNR